MSELEVPCKNLELLNATAKNSDGVTISGKVGTDIISAIDDHSMKTFIFEVKHVCNDSKIFVPPIEKKCIPDNDASIRA